MVAIIPLSEKAEKNKRRITITAEILMKPKEFELLKMLAGNELVKMTEIIDRLFDGKMTYNNKERMYQLISKLKGYGFRITCVQLVGYRCEDDIFIK